MSFVTPSGTNQHHGSLLWRNQNSALGANDFFFNMAGVPRGFANTNTVGAALGGPVLRNKLLYYLNYEAVRQIFHPTARRTILTGDARRGIFTYQDQGGAVRKVNVLQAAGAAIDPAMERMLRDVPGPENINSFLLGDSRESLLRNTAGYFFLRRTEQPLDNGTVKLDYLLSTRHVFSGSFLVNRETDDRDGSESYSSRPAYRIDDTHKLLSAAWRWNPTPRFTNELRGGFNRAPFTFSTSEQFGPYLLVGMVFSNPVDTRRANGRHSHTYNSMDNAQYVRGKHNAQFGFQAQQVRVEVFNESGIIPTYFLGIGTGNPGLTAAQLPGISAADLGAANRLLATLAGYVTSYSQTFNVIDRASGFVSGAPYRRHFSLDNYALCAQDGWKVAPRLNLTLGLRYEYYTVVDERDSLVLLPRLVNNDPVATLRSHATLDFAGSSAGRPWYSKDRNNFAPNVGLAWDVFGNGKMALRAGYAISYINDDALLTLDSNAETNLGLSAGAFRSGLSGKISAGLPAVATPAYKVPRRLEDNYLVNRSSNFGMPDPGLRTPYLQQWTFGVQRALGGLILEARYVGNHAVGIFRGLDLNQVVGRENGFLEDFQRALQNGNLARAAGGAFNPNHNAAIPGSQPLTVFPRLAQGGNLNNATVRNLIETGQVGHLAAQYQMDGLNGPVNFFPNPNALGLHLMTNYSHANYNALQVEVRRQPRRGIHFQANYTFSKALSDSTDNGNRLEPFLDANNPRIERAPSAGSVPHHFKANAIVDLPLGPGHRLNFRPLRWVLEGWSMSGILDWFSGDLFSPASGRGTLNRLGRSGNNTADTLLTKPQMEQLFGFRQTGNGPYFVAASAIGSDGRGVAPDGRPPFPGQAFFNPAPGSIGGLQRRMFTGPTIFRLDLALRKNTRIRERHSVEFGLDAYNALNHPVWWFEPANANINSTNFGRIAQQHFPSRIVRLQLEYRF